MSTYAITDTSVQKEDSALVLQFHDGKQRVTVRMLPGYARTVSDKILGACNDPSQKPHLCMIRAKLEIKHESPKARA